MREIDNELELAVAEEVIKENNLPDYRMCDSHRFYQENGNNKYPYVSLDSRLLLSHLYPETEDKDLIDKQNMILEHFHEDFTEFTGAEFQEQFGFDICFDMNGYRLLGIVPDIEEIREEKEISEEECVEGNTFEEIEEYNEKIIDYANKLEIFNKWAKKYKEETEQFYSEFIIKEREIIHKDEQ